MCGKGSEGYHTGNLRYRPDSRVSELIPDRDAGKYYRAVVRIDQGAQYAVDWHGGFG
jgi:hypothetical protein